MTASKQLIYPQEFVARMLAAKMTKSLGTEYVYSKRQTGFQVHPKFPGTPISTELKSALTEAKAAGIKAPQQAVPADLPYNAVQVTLYAPKETPLYVIAKSTEGKEFWLEKTKLYDFKMEPAKNTVTVIMTKAAAKQRKLI